MAWGKSAVNWPEMAFQPPQISSNGLVTVLKDMVLTLEVVRLGRQVF